MHAMRRRALAAMVMFLAGALALAACLLSGDGDDGGGAGRCEYEGRTYRDGDRWPAGDNCNECFCLDGTAGCTDVLCFDGGVPDAAGACRPTQGCATGPACGINLICCNAGERCVNDTCVCGDRAACGAGDTCEAAGPIGGDACGAICCGASGPCPQ
jgi:hypothetical protein